MSLPGKYCIGMLEEDNPLKSFFRFKPLLVLEEDGFHPYKTPEEYPEDGCIRIVPDRNESLHFKTRMRELGPFAAVDLRRHPHENDKIRPNKNYRGDGVERNAYILYSDVVREAETLYTVLTLAPEEAENAQFPDAPGINRVLLAPEGELLEPVWRFEAADAHQDSFRLVRDDRMVDASGLTMFDLDVGRERTIKVAVAEPRALEPLPAPVRERPAEPGATREIPAAPVPPTPSPAVERPAAQPAPQQRHEEPEAQQPHRRPLDASAGLNPRRGRTLQEIVDDKWRHSRLDQLGLSPDVRTDQPVTDPVEIAASAVRRVWENPEQRGALAAALARFEQMDDLLSVTRTTQAEKAVQDRLTELEAERLQMLDGMEKLRRMEGDLREQLKQQIRREEADAFADATRRTAAAREALEAETAKLEDIRAASESMQEAIRSLSDGTFEKQLRDHAIRSRALELLAKDEAPVCPDPKTEPVDADGLIARVRETFAAAGQTIGRIEAVNLLILAALGAPMLLSGAPGTGKTSTARLFAKALGITDDRLRRCHTGRKPLTDDEDLAALGAQSAVSMVFVEDANMAPGDPTRGLSSEEANWLLTAALQDDGFPVSAVLLDRSSFVRLPEAPVQEHWQPKTAGHLKQYPAVSMDDLRAAFSPKLSELPPAVVNRMDKLRRDLGAMGLKLSRRALNDVWNYCAAAIPLMPLELTSVLDIALSQRVVPALIAGAPLSVLHGLPEVFGDLHRCRELFHQPLPIQI